MRKIANTLIVLGVGAVSLLVLYSLKVNSFSAKETSIILFITSIFIISGLIIKTIINRNYLSKDKIYSRFIFISLYLTSITYFLIIELI